MCIRYWHRFSPFWRTLSLIWLLWLLHLFEQSIDVRFVWREECTTMLRFVLFQSLLYSANNIQHISVRFANLRVPNFAYGNSRFASLIHATQLRTATRNSHTNPCSFCSYRPNQYVCVNHVRCSVLNVTFLGTPRALCHTYNPFIHWFAVFSCCFLSCISDFIQCF